MLDSFAFHSLLSSASPVNKARMLSVSSPHASSWITAIPSTRLKMHLDSAEYQMAIRWWLGLKTSDASPCPFCPDLVLDPLGHHVTSCRHGGDVVIRHNHLRDIVAGFCRQAHLSVRVEVGYGLSRDHSNTRPADACPCSGLGQRIACCPGHHCNISPHPCHLERRQFHCWGSSLCCRMQETHCK